MRYKRYCILENADEIYFSSADKENLTKEAAI